MALKTEARKPLYAVVGAGDLAVENIKDLPTQVVAQATTILPKTTAFVAEIPGKVTVLPTIATSLTGKAFTAYGDLVERGEKLVRSIRRGSATQAAQARVKTAKSQTKAAATSTTKAAKATAKAVEDAAAKIG